MPSSLDEDLKDNYRALRLERGWSWDEMAGVYDAHGDAVEIADFCRSEGAAEARSAAVAPESAPVEREAPAEQTFAG